MGSQLCSNIFSPVGPNVIRCHLARHKKFAISPKNLDNFNPSRAYDIEPEQGLGSKGTGKYRPRSGENSREKVSFGYLNMSGKIRASKINPKISTPIVRNSFLNSPLS